MTIQTLTNYSAATVQYADADTDLYNRQYQLAALAIAFDLHQHDDTKGLGVFRLQTTSAPAASGQVQIDTANHVLLFYDSALRTLVERTATQTLTNKTLTAPVIATIVNTGTLTLPTSTDTLVGRATTDTLTNKTLTSPAISSPTFSGSASGLAVGSNTDGNAKIVFTMDNNWTLRQKNVSAAGRLEFLASAAGTYWQVGGQDGTGSIVLGAKVGATPTTSQVICAAPSSDPGIGSISTSQVTFYLDEAGSNLKFRVKYSDGTTSKIGTVAVA